jgi:hypothetical protein
LACSWWQAVPQPRSASETAATDLAGEWRAQLQFTSGAFASIKDLEFMYAFNQGGTMTESSNYDASPPVPPAYGIWRKVGDNQYEAKYEFYVTKPPAGVRRDREGWRLGSAGRGVFVERITVSADGKSFTSKIKYDQFDTAGKTGRGWWRGDGEGSEVGVLSGRRKTGEGRRGKAEQGTGEQGREKAGRLSFRAKREPAPSNARGISISPFIGPLVRPSPSSVSRLPLLPHPLSPSPSRERGDGVRKTGCHSTRTQHSLTAAFKVRRGLRPGAAVASVQ